MATTKAKPAAKSAPATKAKPAATAKKAVAPATAKGKAKPTPAKVAEKRAAIKQKPVEAAKQFFKPDYDKLQDAVEQKFKLGQGGMDAKARQSSVMSTGLLGTDLMLGGGIYPGAWYTCFGGEGSAKSTHLAHIKIAAATSGVPIMQDYDYEGSSQPTYYEGIMEFASKMRKIHELYGLQDEKGKWVIPAKVRYYNPTVAEDFFNSAASLLRRMANKEFVDGKWWYVWDADKPGRAAAGSHYSKSMYSRYKRLFVEAESGLPQAIFFLDSYPAMYPEALDEDDKGRGMAAIARAMSENVPKILSKLRTKGIVIVGVNQLRLRPAVMHGNPEYEPAGETVKFASSVRIRQAARSVPHGKGPIEEEESEIYEGAKDQYRYIHMKAIKNKLGTPYLESWQRVWVDDGAGNAHGFCPVWDTFQYLKNTGGFGAGSTMKKIKLPDLTDKTITWGDFKALILLSGKDLQSHCKTLGISKPPNIRAKAFTELKSGKGVTKFFENMRSPAEADEEPDDEDEDGDDDED